jgi:PAS domain S-box-containing protein
MRQADAERMIARSLLDNALEGCQVIGPDFRYLYVNDAVARQVSTTRDRLLGRTMMEAHPGIEETAMFAVLRRCMEERSFQQIEDEFAFPDGSRGWFELRFEPVPEGVAIFSLDVTEHRRAEAALRRSNRALTALSECNQALVRATGEQQLMEDVCKVVVERGGYGMAWIGLEADGAGRALRPVACAGRDGRHADLARAVGCDAADGAAPWGRAILSGEPAAFRFRAADPGLAPWHRDAIERGFASCIALPIGDDGRAVGALTIYTAEPEALDGDERALLEEMARDLGYGLAALRGRAARRRAEARVGHLNAVLRGIRNVNQLITRERDPGALIQKTCDLLVESRGFQASCIVICDGGRATARAGAGAEIPALGRMFASGELPECVASAIRGADVVVRHDPARTCAGCPVSLDDDGARDAVAARLESDGKVYGALLVALEPGLASDEEQIDLLREVAGDVAFALRGIEIEAEHRKAAQALARSEARYRELVENIQDVVFSLDAEGKIQFISPAVREYGFEPEEVVGLDFARFVHREDLPAVTASFHRTMNGSVEPVEFRGLDREGRVRQLRVTSRARLEDGRPAGVDGVVIDFTTLRESESRYRSLFKNALVGIAHCRMLYEGGEPSDFVYLDVNPAFEPLTGLKDAVGKKVSELIPGVRRSDPKLFEIYGRVARGGAPERFEVHVEALHQWFDVAVYSPSADHFVAVFDVVTKRKRAEEGLRLFRELVDGSNDALEVIDPASGRILDMNERGFLGLGYSREECQTLTIFDIDPTVDAPMLAEVLERIRQSGSMIWEGVHRRKDGSTFPVEVGIKLVELDRAYLVSVARDITERKAAQDAIRRSRDTQEAMAATLRLSLDDLPLERLLQQILRRVLAVPWLSGERKGAILLVEDEPRVLVMKASEGLPDETRSRCARVPFGVCECGRAASGGEPFHTGEPEPPSEHADRCLSRHGHYCLPIRYGGEVLGVLNVHVPSGHVHAQEEVDFLIDVANTLAGIIARRRTAEERSRVEEQLKVSQRLEAVGRLAGGVAHDFNNLLSVIVSYSGFAIGQLREGDPVREDIGEVHKAGQRAASLTRQLLAFSRKQVMQVEVMSLNQVVGGFESLLRRLLGEDIDIVVLLAEGLGSVKADPAQIEQVIMNLAVNARDAMPHGGKLTIETANVDLDAAYAGQHAAVEPGRFVMLSVTDTGCGMDAATKEHAFEPFFTTKEKGTSTGLGLATVYGIVKQSGGHVWVYSEPGRGTTFKVYLPRVDASATDTRRRAASSIASGDETVLVVEDEEAVRGLAARILRMAGYRVLSAASGADALALCAEHEGRIDLLLTDVVMPQMSGRELWERLSKLRPGLAVLYMSGYTDNAIVHHGVLDPGTYFVNKPFSAAELTQKVREALDERRVGAK